MASPPGVNVKAIFDALASALSPLIQSVSANPNLSEPNGSSSHTWPLGESSGTPNSQPVSR